MSATISLVDMTDEERADVRARLREGADVRGPDDCWLWKVGDRYGKLSVRNRSVSVHRIAWESATGERLGDRYALHTCDEPRCVNPRHLYDGTAKQNMEDMHRRRRWPSRRGELHPLCKLTEDELARLRSTGGTNAEVAARFGLSAGYVSELRRGLRR